MDRWRLILHGRHPAANNMAIDEAILCSYLRGEVPPTLRLYEWSVPAVSIGYFQDLGKSSIDQKYCAEAGIELVRRPTGGRAVLHGHDLTFSVCVGDKLVPEKYSGVLGSHLWLMRGVVAGLAGLGISAVIGENPRSKTSETKGTICFEHVAECDVRSQDGTKLAGSAQLRRASAILEQGSMPVENASVSYENLFRIKKILGTSGLTGVSMEEARSALIEGFAGSLGITFDIWNLTEREKIEAFTLAEGRYASLERMSERS